MTQDHLSERPTDGGSMPAAIVEEALERYERPLMRYALRLSGGDGERAADLVQDTFLRLCRAESSSVEQGLAAWLYTVLRNRSHELYRKERRMIPLETTHDSAGTTADLGTLALAERGDELSAVLRAVGRLPARQQELLRLKFVDGLRYKEMAAVTGLTPTNVGFLLHTAVTTIRHRLAAAAETHAQTGPLAADPDGGSR